MYTVKEVEAFHLLRTYLYQGYTVGQKAKEAGDYIIKLAEEIRRAREIGPWIIDEQFHDGLTKEQTNEDSYTLLLLQSLPQSRSRRIQ